MKWNTFIRYKRYLATAGIWIPAVLLLVGCHGKPEEKLLLQPENLLTNGSFEEFLQYPAWQFSAEMMDWMPMEVPCGTTSHAELRFDRSAPDGECVLVFSGFGPSTLLSQRIRCRGKARVQGALWMAAERLSSEYLRSAGGVVQAVFFDGQEKFLCCHELAAAEGTFDWRKTAFDLPIPDGAETVCLALRFRVIARGIWKLDALELQLLDDRAKKQKK